MSMLCRLSLGLTLVLLTACTPGDDRQSLQIARGLVAGTFGQAEVQDPRAVLTREVIDRAGTPLILVDSLQLGGSATMLSIGQAGGHTTWAAGDGAGLTLLDDGFLTATRGYGGDLISADVAEAVAAIRSGSPGPAVRVMRYLDGEDDDYTRSMICTYADAGPDTITIFQRSIAVTELAETCRTRDAELRNRYWIGQDGFIWRSIQYAGEDIGYLQIERLFR